MNRRTALLMTILSGGLFPALAGAQDPPGSDLDDPSRKPAPKAKRKAKPASDSDDLGPVGRPSAPAGEEPPPTTLPEEPGQTWRTFDISRYTSLPHEGSHPQDAIVEYILQRTGTSVWHGPKIAALSASKAQLRVYNSPSIVKTVGEVVKRFTDAQADMLTIRVRFFAASDTRWRLPVHTRLTRVGSGPQGQQIWTMKVEDTAAVLAQLQGYSGFKPILDRKFKIVNGQTMTVEAFDTIDYVVGPQRDPAVGFQGETAQVNEGVTLRLSPLLTLDGDEIDASIDLRANTVKAMHRTRILTRREIGQGEMTVDVPEVVGSRLVQTVQHWPLSQTLLISGGIQPGILQNKGGFLNLRIPGTVPTSTELLVFLDAEVVDTPKPTRAKD